MRQAIHSLKMNRGASLPAAMCVVVFPLHCLLGMPLLSHSPLPSQLMVCVCVCLYKTHLHQMHISGSGFAAVSVSITAFATPGNYYAKITAHGISIKCVYGHLALTPRVTVQPI